LRSATLAVPGAAIGGGSTPWNGAGLIATAAAASPRPIACWPDAYHEMS
jgi:hypothetical protein